MSFTAPMRSVSHTFASCRSDPAHLRDPAPSEGTALDECVEWIPAGPGRTGGDRSDLSTERRGLETVVVPGQRVGRL